MSLRFEARMTERNFDVALDLADGETLAVIGPNGAGKSTLLGLLAGLVRADTGRATLDGTSLFGESRFEPPHSRKVSLLAQKALLFPHLTVLDNVAFGPRSGGASNTVARETATRWLDTVSAGELALAKPGELSGGQAQRVALARALATSPRLLLLDEPLASLDSSAAPALRETLRRELAGRTAIVVTHDVLDIFALADRVLVLDRGRVADLGSVDRVLGEPRSAIAAEMVGLNILDAHSAIAMADVEVLDREPTELDGVVAETVLAIENRGMECRIRTVTLSADIPARRASTLSPGQPVWLRLPRGAIRGFAG